MKNKLLLLFIPILAGLLAACISVPAETSSRGGLSARTLDLVHNAVFEVVVAKPANDPTVYERDLNWDNVPFAIRNDKYYSIGTAFAVSRTELITAFHVVNLGYQSMVFEKYFIRDSKGDVFEIDQITGGSNEKDYLIFSVKGKTFDKFFQLERKYNVGDSVLSIGNALGEGIVVRSGLILGTVPEADSGRWDLLKSSADGNPGNSGGPLVTPDGKVVALVTSLRDNILYSVPASVILDGSRSILDYRAKMRFGHLLLANKFDYTFETSVSLPDVYTSIRRKLREVYFKDYDASMTALFKEAPEYLTGPNNSYLLYSSLSSSFPEVSFVDPNDNNWKLSDFNTRSYSLGNDGRLLHALVSGINFYKIKKPNNISLEKANTDPKYIMDLILQNMRTDRTLWGSDRYRILSYGEPASVGRYQDDLGRIWISAHWVLGFDDRVQVMYILPMPDGPIVLSTLQNSALLQDYEWDLKKLCNHIYAAFFAAFNGWREYLAMEEFIPAFFRDMRFQWNNRTQVFSFSSGNIGINADKNVFDWADDSELFLAPTWFKSDDELQYGVRKVIINRDLRGNDYIIMYRNIVPDEILGSKAMENWNDLVLEKFPFDGTPAISTRENTGSVGVILNTRQPADTLYTLYFSMENPVNEDNVTRRFNALKQGIVIK